MTQLQSQIEPLEIGETHTISSKILDESRQLNIYLPLGYHQDSIYPVIYALDGSRNEDFLHLVGLVQFYNLQFKMEPHIVVGIANVNRKRDFTFPSGDKEMMEMIPDGGGSENFIAFLKGELIPYVEGSFKTNQKRMLIGQSLGGLVASEILLTYPSLFSHYFIISPSLWWDDESLLNGASERLSSQSPNGIWVYLSVGKKEHKIMRKDAKRLRKVLQGQAEIDLHFNLMKNETHASILHNSVYEGLRVLYPIQ